MREENLEVLQAYFDAMARGGPPEAIGYYHEDVVLEVPGSHVASGRYQGHEGIGRFGANMAGATDGTFKLQPVDLLASDDHAVTIARAYAEAKGRSLQWDRVIVSTVRDGKLAHLRFFEGDQAAVDSLLSEEG